MKREIKFRAWDYGRMIYSHNNSINKSNDQNRWFFQTIRGDAPIMQFTGLTDKNGKEIYEGDVLTSKYGDKKPFEILFGEYQTYEEQVDSESTSIGFYCNETDGEQVGFGKSIEGNMDAYEVIGNIYENPELL